MLFPVPIHSPMEVIPVRVARSDNANDVDNQDPGKRDYRIVDPVRRLIAFCLLVVFSLLAIPTIESLAQDRAPGAVSGEEFRCMNCRKINVGEVTKCGTCGYILIYADSEVDAKDLKKDLERQAKFRFFMGWGIIVVIMLLVIFITSLIIYLLVGANRAKRIRLEKEMEASQAAALNPGPAKIAASPFASRKPQTE